MQRAQGPNLRASTHLYRPNGMIFRDAEPWALIPTEQLSHAVRNALPAELQASYTTLLRGWVGGPGRARELERTAEPAAQWLAEHGREIGARTPSIDERTRALGIGPLAEALRNAGLDDLALFNGQGNAFDHEALRCRLEGTIHAWLAGGDLPLAQPAPLLETARAYDALWQQLDAMPQVQPYLTRQPGPADAWRRILDTCGPGGRRDV